MNKKLNGYMCYKSVTSDKHHEWIENFDPLKESDIVIEFTVPGEHGITDDESLSKSFDSIILSTLVSLRNVSARNKNPKRGLNYFYCQVGNRVAVGCFVFVSIYGLQFMTNTCIISKPDSFKGDFEYMRYSLNNINVKVCIMRYPDCVEFGDLLNNILNSAKSGIISKIKYDNKALENSIKNLPIGIRGEDYKSKDEGLELGKILEAIRNKDYQDNPYIKKEIEDILISKDQELEKNNSLYLFNTCDLSVVFDTDDLYSRAFMVFVFRYLVLAIDILTDIKKKMVIFGITAKYKTRTIRCVLGVYPSNKFKPEYRFKLKEFLNDLK